MADLKGGPAHIEQTGKYGVKSIHGCQVIGFETAVDRNIADCYKNEPTNIPRFSLSYPCVGFIWQQSHDGGHDAIGDLAGQDGCGRGVSYYNFGEEVEQIVEPASCDKIVDEVSHSVGPDVDAFESVEGVVGFGIDLGRLVAVLQGKEAVFVLAVLHLILWGLNIFLLIDYWYRFM